MECPKALFRMYGVYTYTKEEMAKIMCEVEISF
jgi:hypothetical protein